MVVGQRWWKLACSELKHECLQIVHENVAISHFPNECVGLCHGKTTCDETSRWPGGFILVNRKIQKPKKEETGQHVKRTTHAVKWKFGVGGRAYTFPVSAQAKGKLTNTKNGLGRWLRDVAGSAHHHGWDARTRCDAWLLLLFVCVSSGGKSDKHYATATSSLVCCLHGCRGFDGKLICPSVFAYHI